MTRLSSIQTRMPSSEAVLIRHRPAGTVIVAVAIVPK
jgi:hypothetical protein